MLPIIRKACFLLPLLMLLALPASQLAEPAVIVALLGDVMLGRGVAQAHAADGWEDAFAPLVNHLEAADLTAGNLESPIGTGAAGMGDYNLCAHAAGLKAVTAADFDLLALANNHMLDCVEGLAGTEQALEGVGLEPVAPRRAVYMDVRGVRLAFLAFDDVSAVLDGERAAALVAEAAGVADVVVVSMHWGVEYAPAPTRRQEELAGMLAAAGADLIWGHHPHVPQRIEWVEAAGGGRALTAYSLGNALFDQTPPFANRGLLLLARVGRSGVAGYRVVEFVIDPRKGVVRKE